MKRSLIGKCLGMLSAGLLALTVPAIAEEAAGVIYTTDNAAAGNHVMAWRRMANGTLTGPAMLATGGAGTGAGLSSQGSVALSHDGRWLFVCNAGSDEISVFAVAPHGLQLVDKVSSGGHLPLSLSVRRHLLYVLNAGGTVGDTDNITGFVFRHGKLAALAKSTRALSGDNTGPAQVSFTDDGDALVVTERNTDLLDTYVLDEDGLATSHKVFPSAGLTPFGFAVGRRDRVFVSEAGGGAPNASSASAYSISEDGDLAVLSAAVPTKQTAACWLVTSPDERFLYTANAGSGTISGFNISHDGGLQLISPGGITVVTGAASHPIDMTFSRDGRFFYVLANGTGTLGAFRAKPDGSLERLSAMNGIPTSAAGLAGR
jgi:6-phosphogluconolactonase (cycloisomerase 2 family)